ncbi:MAG: hypothetical protein A2W80_11635 [Candidatus Riflebacteria bacterium GWC2_50_8]|nr:MAG: hypothetical protein A2W80_11635 [Candidatus Riflebacteria bacterium GWC2_50_8]
MSVMRKFVSLFVVLALVCCANSLSAQELNKNFAHSLGVGNSAQSYEHRIDLPENWAAEGKSFIGRALTLDGKLVVEREELTKTYYYVKVRLPKATLWFAKGSIDITLKAGAAATAVPVLAAPAGLMVSGESYPHFGWAGAGNYSAISLLDRSNGKTLWERVILNDHACVMDEGSVKVGGKYTWAVKQSDETARYSFEAQANFRVGTKQVNCSHCYGHGYLTCRSCNGSGHIVSNGPNNTPVYKICYTCNGTGRERCTFCNGTGHVTVPSIIPE